MENNDDEDEVLLAMAEELGKFVPYVGGPAHAHTLLQPLEQLSQVEETVVRDKAVDSLCKVGEQLPNNSIQEHFVPLIKVSTSGGCGGTRGLRDCRAGDKQCCSLRTGDGCRLPDDLGLGRPDHHTATPWQSFGLPD